MTTLSYTASDLPSLSDSSEDDEERKDWQLLSEKSFERVWDNEQDAAYDDWYDVGASLANQQQQF